MKSVKLKPRSSGKKIESLGILDVAKNGSLAGAVTEFGCSEGIIRNHYFARIGPKAAEAFDQIISVKSAFAMPGLE